jgi:glycosyltransferase involved in cell wall biosynthesis
MPSYIKASSLFLFPSEYEGFGLPPFEAMSLGVPVLYNSRCEVLREEIGDRARSFATDEELPERLGALLGSEDERAACVAGCADLLDRYSWAKAARQYRYLFQVAVDRPLSDIDFPSGAVRPSGEAADGPQA